MKFVEQKLIYVKTVAGMINLTYLASNNLMSGCYFLRTNTHNEGENLYSL